MHNAANHTSNYLMCEKRKCQVAMPFLSPNFLLPPSIPPSSACESWEEQAFARDSAGGDLGGYVWPPRSYTCSFCRREFRSAQALGGHMNVHRRDRARLNQASIISHAGDANYDSTTNANASFLSPNKKEIYSRELGQRRRRIRDFFYDEDDVENDDDGISNKKMNTDLVLIDGSGEFAKSHEELKLSIFSPVEELDLELRLGEKVK